MAVYAGPEPVVNGLIYQLDAANIKSYIGSGVTWNDCLDGATARRTRLDNGPIYSTDRGGVLGFDGLNDMGQVPNLFAFTIDGSVGLSYATFELWYRGRGDTTGGYILTKPWNGNGQYNYLIQPTFFYLAGGTGSMKSTQLNHTSVDNGEWRHLVYWMNPTDMGYYFDGGGISASTAHGITGTIPSSGNLNLQTVLMSLYPYGSGWAGSTSFSAFGDMAMFKVYNRVLTADEVKTNYEATRGMLS